jgi:hypothetical protein
MTAMDRSVIQLSAPVEFLQQINIDGYGDSLVCQAAVTNALLSLLCVCKMCIQIVGNKKEKLLCLWIEVTIPPRPEN